MTTNYTPVPTYHATYPLPDDGEPAVVASVNTPMEDLADGLRYIAGPFANGGTVVMGGEVELTGNLLTISGGLDVRTQPSFFHSDVTFNEDVTLGSSVGDTINVNGTLNILNNCVVGASSGDVFLITATSTFNGNVDLNGTTSIDGALTISGDATISGEVEFTGTVTIGSTGSADSLDVYSNTLFHRDVTIGDDSGTETFTVNSPTSFEDAVTFNDDVTIGAGNNLICGGTATFTGDVTLGNSSGDDINLLGSTTIITLANALGYGGSGAGRVPWRPVILPNANTVYTVASGNVFFARNGTITSTRQFEWTDVAAVDGDWIMVLASDCGTSIELTVDGSFFAAVPGNVNAMVLFVRTGGTWYKAVEIEV